MSERHEELLHLFVDGRLSPDELEEWEAACAQFPTLEADAAAFSQIGTLLREAVDEDAMAMDFAPFMEGVSARLQSEPSAIAPSQEKPMTEPESAPSVVVLLKDWWRKNWTPVLVSAAAAAAVSLWVSFGAQDDPSGSAETQVLVDAVNNEGSKTVLISMPSDEGDSTIIWLLEEEEDEQPTLGEDPI